jgi:hypothetical protein
MIPEEGSVNHKAFDVPLPGFTLITQLSRSEK